MKDNLVKSLREKTGEADLDTMLKTTLGGYSRKSVQEYVSMLRKQQYDMQQSFAEEMQLVQTERDRLARELTEVRARAVAAEEALESAQPLVEKAAALEKDMDEAVERIQTDGARLEQLSRELEEQKAEIQRVLSEGEELRTRLGQSEAEARMLKLELERRAAETAAQVNETPQAAAPDKNCAGGAYPAERPETVQVQLAILDRERETTAKRLESVIRQEKILFQALNECRSELENRRDQNQCLEAENKDLSRRLSEQMWQNISLNREITHMRTTNENLRRKLDEALRESVKPHALSGERAAGDVFLWNFEE